MTAEKKFYITTPIYYPSASPHLGHAYCTTLCDIIARGKRMRGFDTYFLTGLDEHGEKIEDNAAAAGVTPQAFVDGVAVKFLNLWKLMQISNDGFIRTTQPRHYETVQKIFSRFLEQKDVYLSAYKGWYCVHEESYWTETQVGPNHLCPECGRPVVEKEEPAYFFHCDHYVADLLDYYERNPKFITPEGRKAEMVNNFIKPGLGDLCVSRTTFDWGIPVKEAPGHVVYVWLDALTNYITALGYLQKDDSLFQKFWQDPNTEIVHVIGADITRFHTIYWPMFLQALGLRKPNRVFVHGLMMMKDGKMSKSLGNFFTLAEVLEQHSAAALRLLMLQTSYRSPLDFSWERLEGAENSLTRIAGTVENLRWAANHATADADEAASEAFAAKAAETRATFKECMDDDFNTAGAMGAVFGFVTECNQYLEQAGDAADKAAVLAAADTLAELLDTFGVELPEPKVELPLGLLGVAAGLVAYTGDDVDEAAAKILEARAEARAAKNWDLADAIRDQLKDLGLTIEDTAAGTRIKSL